MFQYLLLIEPQPQSQGLTQDVAVSSPGSSSNTSQSPYHSSYTPESPGTWTTISPVRDSTVFTSLKNSDQVHQVNYIPHEASSSTLSPSLKDSIPTASGGPVSHGSLVDGNAEPPAFSLLTTSIGSTVSNVSYVTAPEYISTPPSGMRLHLLKISALTLTLLSS